MYIQLWFIYILLVHLIYCHRKCTIITLKKTLRVLGNVILFIKQPFFKIWELSVLESIILIQRLSSTVSWLAVYVVVLLYVYIILYIFKQTRRTIVHHFFGRSTCCDYFWLKCSFSEIKERGLLFLQTMYTTRCMAATVFKSTLLLGNFVALITGLYCIDYCCRRLLRIIAVVQQCIETLNRVLYSRRVI